ncbi:MAG: hypothetical protein ACRDG9_11380 [Actinomycetota bacterium]
MRRLFAVVLIATIPACGGSSTPTAPVPTPAPTPAPTPSINPYAAACGTPLPSFTDSYGFGIKVQLEPSPGKKILNASPIIKNPDYCTAAGIPGNTICNTRRENVPERVPCDHYLSGISDEGRPGPNWFEDIDDKGTLVKCGRPETHCELKPENQYLLDVYAPGIYVACGGKGSPGTCGVCVLAPSTWGVIHRNPSGLCGLS